MSMDYDDHDIVHQGGYEDEYDPYYDDPQVETIEDRW